MNRSSSVSPLVVLGLYVFAATLVLSPISDLATTVWPPRFTDLGWRYGFLGLMAGYLQTPVLGLVLGMATAYWQGQGRGVRISALLSLLGAVILILAMVTFALDVLAMRQVRPEDQRAGVLVGGMLQELKYFGAFLVLALLGLGGQRMAQRFREKAAHEPSSPGIIRRD
ncbi:MAG: hypothetical protein PVH96_00970 [Gemmatimonadota bacterium]|jgi:hypothetical protein